MSPPPAVRPIEGRDIPDLLALLNAIVDAGGTTAIETRLTEAAFADWFVTGPEVLTAFTALEPGTERPCGFQVLSSHGAPAPGWGDIGTFARRERPVPGVGRALFAATRAGAAALGLVAINAQIRADNAGGLAYYDRMGFRTWRVLPAVPLADGTPVDRVCKRFDLS